MLAILFLAGCASIDRHYESELTPGPDEQIWNFRANAPLPYPEADPDAEAMRMNWLQISMEQAGACPSGYEVTSRRAVQTMTFMGRPVHKIYYTVRCS